MTVTLTRKTDAGERVLVSSMLSELRGIFGEVDMETFDNVVDTICMYLNGQLPLPEKTGEPIAQPT